ncbi:MAG: hypothetical protein KDC36_12965 [Thermoleophilia bacterium]|nr:hypothetical protein [Thermoleophilia bacterium]
MIVAGVALFAAGAGGAVASSHLITGADVRNGSLTGADVRNGSLTGADVRNGSIGSADIRNGSVRLADLAVSARRRVTTASVLGPQGPTGPAGPVGPQGAPGSAGVSGRVIVEESVVQIPDLEPPFERTLTALCPAGTVVLGGGGSISGEGTFGAMLLASSEPTDAGTGWTATWRLQAPAGGQGNYRVRAICAVVG